MLRAFASRPVLFVLTLSIKYCLKNLVSQLVLYLVGVENLLEKVRSSKFADHDFSNTLLIPTVISINHIVNRVEDSWYWGEPNVLLGTSSALKNVQEVADALIPKYDFIEQIQPALKMYTNRQPKHRTTILRVKISVNVYTNVLTFILY